MPVRLTLYTAILIFASTLPTFAQGPSFDCSKATRPDERAICSNPELSRLDVSADAGFEYVRRVYGHRYANSVDLPFLQARHACGADVSCIKSEQLAAISKFRSLGAPVSSSAASAAAAKVRRGGVDNTNNKQAHSADKLLKEASAAFNRGEYGTAAYLYQSLAGQGNADAQNNMGVLYEYGLGVVKSYPEAANWYRKAAKQGDANAQKNLVHLFAEVTQAAKHQEEEKAKRVKAETKEAWIPVESDTGLIFAIDLNSVREQSAYSDGWQYGGIRARTCQFDHDRCAVPDTVWFDCNGHYLADFISLYGGPRRPQIVPPYSIIGRFSDLACQRANFLHLIPAGDPGYKPPVTVRIGVPGSGDLWVYRKNGHFENWRTFRTPNGGMIGVDVASVRSVAGGGINAMTCRFVKGKCQARNPIWLDCNGYFNDDIVHPTNVSQIKSGSPMADIEAAACVHAKFFGEIKDINGIVKNRH